MKVAFCTEDDGDEAIVRRFMERLLNKPVTLHDQPFRYERGGWTQVMKLAAGVARAVHQSTSDGAVFVVDADDSEPHQANHDTVASCRHCRLVLAAKVNQVLTWPRPELPPLKFFFAVPVRAIETWLLIALGIQRPDLLHFGKTASERRQLKQLVWGTAQPDTKLQCERGVEIVNAADLATLRNTSPSFDAFAAAVTAS